MKTQLPIWLLSLTVLSGLGGLGVTASQGVAQTTNPTGGSVDPAIADQSRFFCQMFNGEYTVMYSPQSQPDKSYPWAIPGNLGSQWPAERRCNEISARLERYRPDGLVELQTDVENGYNTVCVTTEMTPDCRIVFTVPPGQDPIETRNQVFENLTVADSGSITQGVHTFTGTGSSVLDQIGQILSGRPSTSAVNAASRGINLKPFLDEADGGTGLQLTGNSGSAGRLNPDQFR